MDVVLLPTPSFLMLQEVLEDDDFLQVSFVRRLVNISVTAIYLTFIIGKKYGSSCFNERVYSSATTIMVAEIGTKLISQEPSKQII
jgi:hypothetical protein